MLLPTHALYRSVNRFVLGKPSFDLDDVPMFFELFNSDDQNSAHSREFILQVLLAGLRAFDDYKVMKCRHVVDLLMRHTDAAGSARVSNTCHAVFAFVWLHAALC
eukprot:c12997_g1_i1.p2 GENE.c12997_g1_i1~~c12997_g1_i1.p2  ORF type:complete len:105 (+),score=29.21 c12997_g1_i1:467-781(+)